MAKTKSKTKLQTFTWSGLDKGRQKASGQLEAASLQIAKLTLRRQGIRVKTIRKRSQPLFIFGLGPRIKVKEIVVFTRQLATICLLYTSPSPRDATLSRMPSSA